MVRRAELDDQALNEYITLLQSLDNDISGRQIDKYYATPEDRKAYARHLEVFEATADFRIVGCVAANRIGKSHLSCYLAALALTGQYPDWWKGLRHDRAVQVWALAVNQGQVRDNLQQKLLGDHPPYGSGLIPRDSIVEVRARQGIPGAVDYVKVRHTSGGISKLSFRAYSEGREALQSLRVDVAILDESPPWPIFEEVLLRTVSTSKDEEPGTIILAFSPLKGLDQTARYLMPNGSPAYDKAAGVATINIAMTDVPHIGPEEIERILANIPEWQRDARIRGLPSAGVGAVYAFDEARMVLDEKPQLLPHWWMGGGLDVGFRNTSFVRIGYDADSGIYTILDEYVGENQTPGENVEGILRVMDAGCVVAIDPSANNRSQLDGKRLLREYRDLGLNCIKADNAVESGLTRCQHLMATGKLKVSPHCTKWLGELRTYSRGENGKPLKAHDHLMDATRYALHTHGVFLPQSMYRKKPKVIRSHGKRKKFI
jgi:phage terminase large subunit-like protein